MHIAHGKSRCVEAAAFAVMLNIIHGADIDGHQQLFFFRLFAREQVFGQNFQRTDGLHGHGARRTEDQIILMVQSSMFITLVTNPS